MMNSFFEKFSFAHMPPTQFFRFEYEPDQCTHCKACVQTCPTSCLQWNEEKDEPFATGLSGIELACIGCNNCEAVCPANCIRLRGEYKVIKGRYKTPEDRWGEMSLPSPFGNNDLNKNFEEIENDLTETEKVIYRRRSVRMFKDKPLEKDLIKRLIEAARFAPSAGNGQPFKFIVVSNREVNRTVDQKCAKLLERIKWLYAGQNWWRKALIGILSVTSPNNWDQRPIAAMEKVRMTKGVITFDAPVVIHVLKDKRGISKPDIDAAISAHNLILTAHSLGLGTCYIGFIASTAPFVPAIKKLLKIEYPYEIVTSICVGYPKVKYDTPVPRAKAAIDWIE
ncbi:MAG: 4Fe-4S dicluster domain-containing protein [Desulfobacterales bacterium]|nr:4Fe-4S dicluster domain-containing protein [Desulfobacteraceae bacterium]MBT7085098.1 4Fe-4S dicluster domain-containing protein [Desulfobacterales bacterium]MBT7697739.1 4Fe-4S dicluster domain-containing protein [Desulfobacterales bacterium]